MPSESTPRIGYVLKMYPRFSETFVVTEILAREARGERLEIFALRPNDDTRFHAELARVQAPVRAVPVPRRLSSAWEGLRGAAREPELSAAVARHLRELLSADADDALQAIEVARQAHRRGITHLHAHFASTATTVARLAALLAGIPYSFTAHAKDIFHSSVDPVDLEQKLADAAFAVTVSDFNLHHLQRTYRATATVARVYNGLDLDRFPFVPRPARGGTLRLLAVGRLVEKKGFALLIDAVERLRSDGIDVTLDIVGDGELSAPLRARAEASARAPRSASSVRSLRARWRHICARPTSSSPRASSGPTATPMGYPPSCWRRWPPASPACRPPSRESPRSSSMARPASCANRATSAPSSTGSGAWPARTTR